MTESGLEVRVLGEREAGDRMKLARDLVSAIARIRVIRHIQPREIDLPQRGIADDVCFASIIRLISEVGSGSPVSKCRLKLLSIAGCQHQCSSICDGASTKSRSTLVPLKRVNREVVSV